jgi:glycosyltransferase involved in cell wall biosynthesis
LADALKLSVIMPCYNEKKTIEEIIRQVLDVDLAHQIVIIDDGSTDGTRDILCTL